MPTSSEASPSVAPNRLATPEVEVEVEESLLALDTEVPKLLSAEQSTNKSATPSMNKNVTLCKNSSAVLFRKMSVAL